MYYYVFVLIVIDLVLDVLFNGFMCVELDVVIKGYSKGVVVWIGRFGNF